jgi:hypothetical protein
MDIIILVLYFVEGMDRYEMDGYFIFVRASIIRDCKQTECRGWRREGRRERGEAGCKLTADLDTRTKKLGETDKWTVAPGFPKKTKHSLYVCPESPHIQQQNERYKKQCYIAKTYL